jgi:hypothetical protein
VFSQSLEQYQPVDSTLYFLNRRRERKSRRQSWVRSGQTVRALKQPTKSSPICPVQFQMKFARKFSDETLALSLPRRNVSWPFWRSESSNAEYIEEPKYTFHGHLKTRQKVATIRFEREYRDARQLYFCVLARPLC